MTTACSKPVPWWKTSLRWIGLIVLSIGLSLYMDSLGIPAAYMLGAIITAMLFSISNQAVALPKPLFLSGQGVVGAMIANAIPLSVFGVLSQNWLLFIAGIGSVLLLSNLLGLFMAKRNILPGTTAIWGTSPGAATAMTIMAEEYGADVRMVALMQYIRVVMVALAAILVTHFSTGSTISHTHSHLSINWQIGNTTDFTLTLVLVAAGVVGGKLLKLGAGPLLVTLALALIFGETGLVNITLPQPLLLISYALIGWNIGFRFNRNAIKYAFRLLPRILISTTLLIATCGALSHLLVIILGIDPLTAYLAMSPGGADSVAIIAASGHADMSFVMAMQTGRLILVVLSGPPIARWLASHQQSTRQPSTGKSGAI